jgi:hypothetical protein
MSISKAVSTLSQGVQASLDVAKGIKLSGQTTIARLQVYTSVGDQIELASWTGGIERMNDKWGLWSERAIYIRGRCMEVIMPTTAGFQRHQGKAIRPSHVMAGYNLACKGTRAWTHVRRSLREESGSAPLAHSPKTKSEQGGKS